MSEEMILKFYDEHLNMSHKEWLKERENKRARIAASYDAMKTKGRNNNKL